MITDDIIVKKDEPMPIVHSEEKHNHKEMVSEFHCAIHDMFKRINSRVKGGAGISISEMSCLTDMVKDLSESLCHLSKFSYYDEKMEDEEKEKKEESEEAVL